LDNTTRRFPPKCAGRSSVTTGRQLA
jgi:hypothetical protein